MRKVEKIKKTCQTCNKTFEAYPYRADKAKYCSFECYWKSLQESLKGNKRGFALPENSSKGANNWNWKGGKRWSQSYLWILKPNHPRASKQGYIKNANLVMEKKLGRILKPNEFIHHKDRNRSNDSPENLELTNRRKHIFTHRSNLK